MSRKEIDDYTAYVGRYGAKGLAYIKVNDVASGREGLQSPILKFLPDDVVSGIVERTQAIAAARAASSQAEPLDLVTA